MWEFIQGGLHGRGIHVDATAVDAGGVMSDDLTGHSLAGAGHAQQRGGGVAQRVWNEKG